MSDHPASDAEDAIQRLIDEIREEPVPERILVLARQLQAALDRQEAESRGKREK
jgi:hypothetical protein